MDLLIDMNLAPGWVEVLEAGGHSAVHWSTCGDPRATDAAILEWARRHSRVVLTADLDFGTLLALTTKAGPSVVQIVLPVDAGGILLRVLESHGEVLAAGALITIDATGSRARVLPIRR